MTRKEIKTWQAKDGITFLKELGLQEGQIVVDFGCNEGHYTIPAGKIVNGSGKVYAIDKTSRALRHVEKAAKDVSLSNITTRNTNGLVKIDLPASHVDLVLLYDVLHFLSEDERKEAYREARKVLKPGGMLSVHPKHNKEDWPMMSLSDKTVDEVIEEIENEGFTLRSRKKKRLFHDEGFDNGFILNFTR